MQDRVFGPLPQGAANCNIDKNISTGSSKGGMPCWAAKVQAVRPRRALPTSSTVAAVTSTAVAAPQAMRRALCLLQHGRALGPPTPAGTRCRPASMKGSQAERGRAARRRMRCSMSGGRLVQGSAGSAASSGPALPNPRQPLMSSSARTARRNAGGWVAWLSGLQAVLAASRGRKLQPGQQVWEKAASKQAAWSMALQHPHGPCLSS